MDGTQLKSAIESILFMSGEPVKIDRIAKITGMQKPLIENAVMELQNEYSQRGITIIKKNDEIQMATNPQNSEIISGLLKCEMQEGLSRAALEVLSIVAYRGPISRIAIESIRGVNCSFTLRTLLMRGLVDRIDNPKDSRSYLYEISFEFLKKMGLSRKEDLPDWDALSNDPRISNVSQEAKENINPAI